MSTALYVASHLNFSPGVLINCAQLDTIPVDQITKWEAEFRAHLTSAQSPLLEEISKGNITPEIEGKIKKVVEDHVSSFTS